LTYIEAVRQEFRGMKGQVEDLLRRYPDARNNDFYLIWLWLKEFSGLEVSFSNNPVKIPFNYLWLEYEDFKKIAGRLETVTRARRKIQAEGLFLPTDHKVLFRRRRKQKAMRRVMATEKMGYVGTQASEDEWDD